jgi:hypothetical protein
MMFTFGAAGNPQRSGTTFDLGAGLFLGLSFGAVNVVVDFRAERRRARADASSTDTAPLVDSSEKIVPR